VLQYHVISRPGVLPDDFRPGAPLTTLLPGHDVTLRYTRYSAFRSAVEVEWPTHQVLTALLSKSSTVLHITDVNQRLMCQGLPQSG
jgi:hypothetical protein